MHKARTVRGGCGFAPAALSGVSRDGTWADLVVVPATLGTRAAGRHFFRGGRRAVPCRHGRLWCSFVKAGQRLLVLGANGGVGSAAVQLGKALGASVVAVALKWSERPGF